MDTDHRPEVVSCCAPNLTLKTQVQRLNSAATEGGPLELLVSHLSGREDPDALEFLPNVDPAKQQVRRGMPQFLARHR